MCSACITSSPRGVEQRRRAVAPLLDVGRVRRADQHRAHLLAGGAKRADQHLERDRVEAGGRARAHRRLASAPRSSRVGSTSALQPGGSTSVASGSSKTHGPSARSPAGGLAAQHLGLDPLAAEAGRAAVALEPGARRRRRLDGAGPATTIATRMLTSSTSASASR